MPKNQDTNPWGDAANQAVGALYKYYMSQPTAADHLKQQYMQAQIDRMGTQNTMDKRQMDMGDFALPNLSPEIRNDQYRRKLEGAGDRSGAQLFGTYVNKPMQVDAGDTKYIADGSTGLPMQAYGVGVAPSTQFDKENNRTITMPGVPSTNRPAMPIADLFGSVINAESGGDPMAMSPKGAAGIAQIMPSTARDPGYGVPPLAGWDGVDPRTAPVEEQMRFGQDYLNAMINNRGGNVSEGVAAYNAGPGAVAEHGGIPPYPETQQYVQKVMGGAGQPQRVAQNTVTQPDGTMITELAKPAAEVEREGNKTFNQNRKTNGLNQTIESAMFNIAQGGAGIGSYAKDIPLIGGQTKAAALEADLSKITNAAAIDEIARLKEESKTGGFFGNLSDGERQAVADSQLAIRQTMNPQELAYRLAMHQDLVNDIVYHRGQADPVTGQVMPMDAGAPRSGLPTTDDIHNAQSVEDLTKMWDAFGNMPAFGGKPPEFIEQALVQRVNELRGGQ